MTHPLTWKKFHPLSDQNAFICLVDHMGDDSSIVQAARVSYGKDETYFIYPDNGTGIPCPVHEQMEAFKKDRALIRYLMNHQHWTPFEMVEIKFMVQVPMDCWRQWIRHRTANVNEYSTRYTEALDFFQVTLPQEWRMQATDNKQGSSGFLEEWPENFKYEQEDYGNFRVDEKGTLFHVNDMQSSPSVHLSELESNFHAHAKRVYQERLSLGVAKEQARKDLPLSTYTRAYWKCDLRNIFNFLQLRMDSHAQYEIRMFANCMAEIVKALCPVAYGAFEDYVLNAKKFSAMEMEELRSIVEHFIDQGHEIDDKPSTMTDREWKDFLGKLS